MVGIVDQVVSCYMGSLGRLEKLRIFILAISGRLGVKKSYESVILVLSLVPPKSMV